MNECNVLQMQTLYKLRYPDENAHQIDPFGIFVVWEEQSAEMFTAVFVSVIWNIAYMAKFSMDSIRQSVLGNVLRESMYK